MISRRHLLTHLVILMAIGLLLVACERPTPGRDDTQTENIAVDVSTEGTAADPNVGGGTEGSETVEQPVLEEPADTATDTQPADAATDAQPADAAADTAVTEQPAATTDTGATDTTTADDTAAAEQPAVQTTETDQSQTTVTQVTGEQPATHTVAAGENLYRIGLKYGISWVKLAEYNNLPNPHRIYVGQVLKLAPSGNSGGQPTPTPSPATETTYIVQPGDNLFRIGLKYGISWIQIAEANGLVNPNIIKVGDTLKIPVNAPGPSPQFTHLVRPGDTLFKISLQYGIPWPAIATANNIPAPYVIYVGQTIRIPGQ